MANDFIKEVRLQGGGIAKLALVREAGEQYWAFPTSERLSAARQQKWEVEKTVITVNGTDYLAHVTMKCHPGTSAEKSVIGYGSCGISGLVDAAGVALRRAICSAIMMAGLFPEVFDEQRRLNGRTLDAAKSDPLNESVMEKI
jgi:hypothetical protein